MDRPKLLKYALVGFIILVVGFIAGKQSANSQIRLLESSSFNISSQDPVFQEQNAVIEGKITKIDGNLLTIQNKFGDLGTFTLSSQAVIYKTMNKEQVATPAAGVNAVDLQKNAFIFLKMIDNQYQINSINYITAEYRAKSDK